MVKNPPTNEEDMGSIPRLGRYPGEGISSSLQYCCLGYPKDRGGWWATVHGVTEELDTTYRINNKNNKRNEKEFSKLRVLKEILEDCL